MASEWIPASDRLPEHGGTVLCRTLDRRLEFGRVMTIRKYDGGEFSETYCWMGYPDGHLNVTHWFPLPEPPGGEVMYCPICAQKPMNCDCTEVERQQFSDIKELEKEIARLRLTEKEREAIRVAASDFADNDMGADCWQIAATLRGLLDRTRTFKKFDSSCEAPNINEK